MFFNKRKKPKERLLFNKKVKQRKAKKSATGIEVKNVELETRIFKLRVILGCIVVLICFSVLFANLYNLQVISYDDYQTRSNENRIRVLPVVPQRGIIYDRNHVVLAENRPVFHLVLFPHKDIDTRDTIARLDALMNLELTPSDVEHILELTRTRQRFSGVEVADLLTEEQIAVFSVNRHHFPNVQLSSDLKRYYPFSSITTHAIGYVSRINAADIEKLTEQWEELPPHFITSSEDRTGRQELLGYIDSINKELSRNPRAQQPKE